VLICLKPTEVAGLPTGGARVAMASQAQKQANRVNDNAGDPFEWAETSC
jgi:hypothetical protein